MTQANRTLLTLALLLVVGGGVGLYAWTGIYVSDKKEAEKKDNEDRLFMPSKAGEKKSDGGIVESEFLKLTVIAKGDTTVLERTPGQPWRITSPVSAVADKVGVDALVSQLQQSKFKHVIDENPDPATVTKYGLDKPDFSVEAVAEVGPNKERRTVKLEAGIENTYDGSIYMRRNGEPKVLSAEGGVKWTMAKSTYDLRDKDVLGIDEARVRSVEVKGKNNEYTLKLDDKKVWHVEAHKWFGSKAAGDTTFDGDPTSITGTLGSLKGEKATKFIADAPAARAQFETPTLEATFTLEGDKKVRLRLLLGEQDAGVASRVLVERDGETTIAEIPGNTLASFDRLPTEFRDKRIMPFKKEEVARIKFLTATGVELVVEKASPDAGTADSWRVVAPKEGPAKTLKIAALLWTLGAMKQHKSVEENPKDPGKYGLDTHSRSVSIDDAAGKPIGHFEWGKEVPGDSAYSYFRGSRGEVVEADPSRLNDFPKAVEDLLDLPPDAGAVFTPDAGK